MMLTGLLFICFFFKNVMIGICCLLVGLGYGIFQPLIYDKTTHIFNSEARISEYLSYILSMNYFAIVCAPFIVDFIDIRIGNKAPIIPFIINSIIGAGILLVSIFGIKSFAFCIKEEYYEE